MLEDMSGIQMADNWMKDGKETHDVCGSSVCRIHHAHSEVLIPMTRFMTLTYYHHSGFSAAVDDILLVFDYWLGEHLELPVEKRITEDMLRQFREVYVFISHEHADHLDPTVFEWRKVVPVTYVVSMDMPIGTRGRRMAPGDTLTLSERVKVKAFDSTDLGVSFLVEVCGFTLFHAGDLNFWHWREESTLEEIEQAEKAFQAAVAPIEKESIDVAFFPVDPRQGRLFDAGANYFILSVKPHLLLPMHFWGRAEVAVEFARRSRCNQTEVLAMTRYGEQIRLEKQDDATMTVHLLSKPEPVAPRPSIPQETVPASNDTYDDTDPFAETDLPVKLDE
ncbi:MAG: MBL fold metallo-hydrolase [Aristaeellaceae bacterium]